ncbi:MAG: hypothetical protein WBP02_16195, partial [Gammaproteobacteria bacterium]
MKRAMYLKYVLATAFLALFVVTTRAAIAYDVNRTIVDDKSSSVGTITRFMETDGALDQPVTENNILNWSLSLNTPELHSGNPRIITLRPAGKMTLRGSTVTATTSTSTLWSDFTTEEKNNFLLLTGNGNADGRNEAVFWCLDTLNCSSGLDNTEIAGIVNGTVLSEDYAGKIVMATAVPAPEAVWLFGSGLLVLAGMTRR